MHVGIAVIQPTEGIDDFGPREAELDEFIDMVGVDAGDRAIIDSLLWLVDGIQLRPFPRLLLEARLVRDIMLCHFLFGLRDVYERREEGRERTASWGSEGSGEQSMDWREMREDLSVNTGDQAFLRMSRQIAPVDDETLQW